MADRLEDSPQEIAKRRKARQQTLMTRAMSGVAGVILLGIGYGVVDYTAWSDDHLREAYVQQDIDDMHTYIGRVDVDEEQRLLLTAAKDGNFAVVESLGKMHDFSSSARSAAFINLYNTGEREVFDSLSKVVDVPGFAFQYIFLEAASQGDIDAARWVMDYPSRDEQREYWPAKGALRIAIEHDRLDFARYVLEDLGQHGIDILEVAQTSIAYKNLDALKLVQEVGDVPQSVILKYLDYIDQYNAAEMVPYVMSLLDKDVSADKAKELITNATEQGQVELLEAYITAFGDKITPRDYAWLYLNKALVGGQFDAGDVLFERVSENELYRHMMNESSGGGWVRNVIVGFKRNGVHDALYARAIIEGNGNISNGFIQGNGVIVEDVTRVYTQVIVDGYGEQVRIDAQQRNTKNSIVVNAFARAEQQAIDEKYGVPAKYLAEHLFASATAHQDALFNLLKEENYGGINAYVSEQNISQTDVRDLLMSSAQDGQADVFGLVVGYLGVRGEAVQEAMVLAVDNRDSDIINALFSTTGNEYWPVFEAELKTIIAEDTRDAMAFVDGLELGAEQQNAVLALFDTGMHSAIRNQWSLRP